MADSELAGGWSESAADLREVLRASAVRVVVPAAAGFEVVAESSDSPGADWLGDSVLQFLGDVASRGESSRPLKSGNGRVLLAGCLSVAEPVEGALLIAELDGEVDARTRRTFESFRRVFELGARVAELRSIESEYQELLDGACESIHVIDMKSGNYCSMNNAGLEMLGITRDQLPELSLDEISAPMQRDGLPTPESLARRMQILEDEGHYEGEWQVIDPVTRELRVHEIRVSLLSESRIRVMEYDITDRVRAEEALRESEENLRATLDSIGDAVISTDVEGRILGMNPVAENLTGWAVDEARHRPLAEILRLESEDTGERLCLEEPFERSHRSGRAVLTSRAGGRHDVALSGAPVRGADGELTGAVMVLRDVTEERELQERLRQSEKLNAVGQLAGGIAHDFNNVLAAIVAAAEVISMNEAKTANPETEECLATILSAADDAADLTSKLVAFGRVGRAETELFSVHDSIRSVRQILDRTIDRRIFVELSEQAIQDGVVGDRVALENALLNMAINSSHAMVEAGGKIRFATRNRSLEAGSDLWPELGAGEYVEIEISDDGTGIEPQHLSRIFEPFFTTKQEGQGSGLGLAAVYGTVQRHHGAVRAHSAVGEGTTLTLLLPCQPFAQSAQIAFESSAPVESLVASQRRVLVVDDELHVRRTIEMALTAQGYEVVLAGNGAEALELHASLGDRLDCVVMDMNMPGMDGAEAIRRLRQSDRHCAIVVSSGFSKAESFAEIEGVTEFLRKPYRMTELRRAIERAIAVRAAQPRHPTTRR